MEILALLRSQALSLPSLAKFALGMALIIVIPPLSKRALAYGETAVLVVCALMTGGGIIKAGWQN